MTAGAAVQIVLESADPARRQLAERLATRLGKGSPALRAGSTGGAGSESRAISAESNPQLLLAVHDNHLELRQRDMRPGAGLTIDFSELHPKAAARRGGFSRRQPLAKAIGRSTWTVLDATAGLGHDAALLACMGYRVTAVERSPIIHALLEDAFARAQHDPEMREAFGDRLTFMHGDARAVLQDSANRFDVVYIDPMFPPKRKASALASKAIRLVRAAVGDDPDAAELLALARKHAPRVAVKRPTHAQPLAADFTASFGGKLVRYDIYSRVNL